MIQRRRRPSDVRGQVSRAGFATSVCSSSSGSSSSGGGGERVVAGQEVGGVEGVVAGRQVPPRPSLVGLPQGR